jgi:hypothetical protein
MSNTKKCSKGKELNKKTQKCLNFRITKKQGIRLENSRVRKSEKQLYDEYVTKFNNDEWSNLQLIEESTEILKQLKQIENGEIRSDNLEDLEIQYNALSNVMELRLIDSYTYTNKFSYPDYEDPDFNEKISKKKEFYINKIPSRANANSNTNAEVEANKLCNPLYGVDVDEKREIDFNLTHNQKFLKSFMSPSTPYNSMLLFHGTGVGKTCTSISIAEQYSEQLRSSGKRIIILLNPSIRANFIKNIFNIQKVKQGMPYYQCTGDKYLDDYDKLPHNVLEDKVNKIIKGRYEFYGYQKFANILENLQKKIRDKYPSNEHTRMINKKLKETFSDSVIIIDEVHNIKEGDDLKVLPPLLEKVVSVAVNMKLLLLSATPMFDTSNEIIFLINLMLRNNKKPIIYATDYIDKDGNIKPSMRKKFIQKTRGLISYMRGEDPYRFPLRLYPERQVLNYKDMPRLDKDGKNIKDELRIHDLKIVPCVMKGFQLQVYEKMENAKEKYGAFNQGGVMCSNIVFPIHDVDNISSEKYNFNSFISNEGFNNIIKKEKMGGQIKYSITHPKFDGFFDLKNINNYSAKIANIIKNINKSEGIVFIYSQYINAGIVPLALALEYAGYSKYGNSLIKDRVTPIKGNYIIISGSNDLSANAYAEYIKIQDSNKNGEKIKIILGSETAAEGLDFSYIRQVHILDPWFHLNKIEQVIGRGIRNCSHIDLPSKDRNVTIFLYAAVKSLIPINENETVDLEIYRKAEIKSRQMSEIEYLLKTSAVDCYLNINGNKFENDVDGSKKCNYKECDYKCSYHPDPDTTNKVLNKDTFDLYPSMISTNIYEIKRKIIKLYKKNNYYDIDDFISILDADPLLIYFALNDIIDNNIQITNKFNKIGTIIYNGIYVFINKNGSKFVSSNNLRTNTKKRIGRFNISHNNVLSILSKTKKPTKQGFNPKVSIDKEFENISNELKIILDEFPINNDVKHDLRYIPNINSLNINSKKITNTLKKIVGFKETTELNTLLKIKLGDINKYYVDFIPIDDKEILIRYIIFKSLSGNLSHSEKDIKSNLSNILYVKKDVYFEDLLYKGPEKIWGYKTINGKKIEYKKFNYNYKTISDGTKIYYDKLVPVIDTNIVNDGTVKNNKINQFVNATETEIKQIQKSFKKKMKTELEPYDIIGYFELRPNKTEPEFKIRDKREEIKDIKKGKSKGSHIKTGSVCNDGMKKPKIVAYIETLLDYTGNDVKDFKKSKLITSADKNELCKYLELILRYKDITNKTNRYFYGPEETIEYKLTEKIF